MGSFNFMVDILLLTIIILTALLFAIVVLVFYIKVHEYYNVPNFLVDLKNFLKRKLNR